MLTRNRLDVDAGVRDSHAHVALRIAAALGVGSVAWFIGYSFARFAGGCVVCAAGRSPASLGIVLGIAAAGATWAILRVKHAPSVKKG